MSSNFQQAPHKLLVYACKTCTSTYLTSRSIPGPIEFSNGVLAANATPGTSHVSPAFVPVFGECIKMLRKVLYAEKTGQPFLIAGSGTMGWDAAGANLIEAGENALVLDHGYFGAGFADCLETYGAKVTKITAKIGGIVSDEDLVAALQKLQPKLITITHVDTSTGVLSPIAHYSELIKKHSPNTLIAVDAVCAVASEEIRFDDWGLDVVISATQKGLGVPPGLSLVWASKRALDVTKNRKTPVPSYYINWNRWLPIMQAYEEGRPAYFATPPVQLVYSLHEGLKEILEQSPSLEERFALHKKVSNHVKDELAKLGCGFVPLSREHSANGMTAAKYPEGVSAAIIPKLADLGVVVAGGLHKEIASTYFRIGHMGITVVDPSRGDIQKVLSSVSEVFAQARGA